MSDEAPDAQIERLRAKVSSIWRIEFTQRGTGFVRAASEAEAWERAKRGFWEEAPHFARSTFQIDAVEDVVAALIAKGEMEERKA